MSAVEDARTEAVAYVVVQSSEGLPENAFGPFDEDEAGTVCAASIANGADPSDIRVVPLRAPRTPTATFRVERTRR